MKKSGFTLIEVILALVLFGGGILTLLHAIIFFVGSGDEVRAKAQATLLAKEAMDIIYNQRDTNLRRAVRRDCAKIDIKDITTHPDACSYVFASGTSFQVSFEGNNAYTITPTNSGNNALYTSVVNGVTIYTSNPAGMPTQFTRTVSFQQASMNGQALANSHVLKMTVRVGYMPASPDRAVVLESYLAAGDKTE